MKKTYHIVILRQIGNIGAHEIEKVKEQPKEGFEYVELAEVFLQTLLQKAEYPYDRPHAHFSILPFYTLNQ